MKVLFAVDGSASSFDAVAQVAPLATAGKVRNKEAVAPDGILIMKLRNGAIEQDTDVAFADFPSVAEQQLRTRFEVFRLVRIIAPDRSCDFEPGEIEGTA